MKRLVALTMAVAAGAVLCSGAAFAQEKTFKVWWYEDADSPMGISWQNALDEFQEQHPDVKVQFELKTFDQINQAGSLILNSSQAPDVLEYNKGNGTAGLVASQGLLQPLDDEYTSLGWDKILNETAIQLGRYDENGVFGSGPLYGIPTYGEFISVFYNKDLLDEYGVKEPTTLEEFEQAMDVFVKAGITPLAMAANDYPAQHLMYSFALSKADDDWIANYEGLKTELDPAPFKYAGEKLVEWVNDGYISSDATGMTSDDMEVQFKAGKTPFVITGSWYNANFHNNGNFEVGQFLFPSTEHYVGSTGNMWVVPASAENKDLAYDFISLTLSEENQDLMGNSSGVPVAANADKITDPVGKTATELFTHIVESGGLGFYPDWPIAGFYNEVLQATQAVVGGRATPEEFAQRLKTAYDDGMAF